MLIQIVYYLWVIKMNKMKQYFWLFKINIFISAFTFGGGYVVITMIRKYFVEDKKYFDEDTLLEMAAISQSSPGAIAINFSGLAGYYVAGLPGAIISCVAAIIPPLCILTVVSMYYQTIKDNAMLSAVLKGMEAGVAALIVDVVISMYQVIYQQKLYLSMILIPLSFVANFFFNIHVLYIIFFNIFICLIIEGVKRYVRNTN